MDESPPTLGERVRRARKERGFSAQEVAAKSGLSRATLTRLEGGRGNPTYASIVKIAEALGIPASDFISSDLDVPARTFSGQLAAVADPSLPARVVLPASGEPEVVLAELTPGGAVVRSKGDRVAMWTLPDAQFYLGLPGYHSPQILAVFVTELGPEQAGEPASAHQGDEFVVVLDGSVAATIGKRAYPLEKGDALLILSDTSHRLRATGGAPARLVTVRIQSRTPRSDA